MDLAAVRMKLAGQVAVVRTELVGRDHPDLLFAAAQRVVVDRQLQDD